MTPPITKNILTEPAISVIADQARHSTDGSETGGIQLSTG